MDNEIIVKAIDGPVIHVTGGQSLPKMSLVYVGELGLPGEVISVDGNEAVIQIYEDSSGLSAGQKVTATGKPLSVLLGPGMIGQTYDGIARPLKKIEITAGPFITRGIRLDAVDGNKEWEVKVDIKEGQNLSEGQIFARVQESEAVEHRSMVPPGLSGRAVEVKPDGVYTATEPIAYIEDDRGVRTALTLSQRWPVRTPRPARERLNISTPLFTGQRVLDTFFPVGKGGCAAIPGPFGAGKTMVQHQLAKWCDADIIVYLGCGERGNEMTEVLDEFRELKDPRTGSLLMERTILIANTSNMPVAAREASIYTGMTIAEYYRDMGYDVALMADSTSRWAEALREISGRLEEMPAEESFPAYLPSRLSGFYERAGCMKLLCGKTGSVTAIGAVSPQGGDFSEPVTQSTKRFVRTFWGLDRSLAYARHFPAINWNSSYSEYFSDCAEWYSKNYGQEFLRLREEMLSILAEEAKLMEIAKLIGSDVLPDDQKLILSVAKLIREGFLQQNAFDSIDTYMTAENQESMLEIIDYLYTRARKLVERQIPLSQLEKTAVYTDLIRMKTGLGQGKAKKVYFDLIDAAVSKVEEANGVEN